MKRWRWTLSRATNPALAEMSPGYVKIRGCQYCAEAFIATNPSKEHCSEFCRFWSKVDYGHGNGCWEWTGALLKDGYGGFDASFRAHRLSWEGINGKILDGLSVCHACDNRRCVRPGHLWLGSTQDNLLDRDRKKRHGYGERNGMAKLTEGDVADILTSPLNGQELARQYGVDRSSISKARQGKNWKHLNIPGSQPVTESPQQWRAEHKGRR